jgi:hypothetical protein
MTKQTGKSTSYLKWLEMCNFWADRSKSNFCVVHARRQDNKEAQKGQRTLLTGNTTPEIVSNMIILDGSKASAQ